MDTGYQPRRRGGVRANAGRKPKANSALLVRMPTITIEFCDLEARRLGLKNAQAYIVHLVDNAQIKALIV